MKIIKQLFWIFLFSFIGELSSFLLAHFMPIPGSVIGMVLLFLALHFDILALSAVDEVGNWLTDNMAIFFVPAGVGLMTNLSILADFWLVLLIIALFTTVIMLSSVGFIVQKLNITKGIEKND